MVSFPLWLLVAGTLAWCGVAMVVSFSLAVLRPRRAVILPGRKAELAVIAIFLALPFMLLSGLLPWANARVTLNFTYGWVTPCKLLLLCVANFLLDSPAWTLSRFSHFLLAMLLPVRIKGPVVQGGGGRRRVKESLRTLLVEVAVLMLFFCWYDRVGEAVRHAAHGVVLYLVLDLPHRIASMGFLVLYGMETHPAFHQPWFSSSLTDFWGNRWDLTANALLRHSVYNPLVNLLLQRTERDQLQLQSTTTKNGIDIQLLQLPYAGARPANIDVVKRRRVPLLMSRSSSSSTAGPLPLWVRLIAVNTTFFISGLIHELLYFSLTQTAAPTWEVTAFFIVHGLATSAEITLRRARSSHTQHTMAGMPRPLKIVLTMLFMYSTTAFLFFPQLVRAGIFTTCTLESRAMREIISNIRVPNPNILIPLGPSRGSLLY